MIILFSNKAKQFFSYFLVSLYRHCMELKFPIYASFDKPIYEVTGENVVQFTGPTFQETTPNDIEINLTFYLCCSFRAVITAFSVSPTLSLSTESSGNFHRGETYSKGESCWWIFSRFLPFFRRNAFAAYLFLSDLLGEQPFSPMCNSAFLRRHPKRAQ